MTSRRALRVAVAENLSGYRQPTMVVSSTTRTVGGTSGGSTTTDVALIGGGVILFIAIVAFVIYLVVRSQRRGTVAVATAAPCPPGSVADARDTIDGVPYRFVGDPCRWVPGV